MRVLAFIILIFIVMQLFGCAQTNSFTREQVNEFCSHSKQHRDIMLLPLTDKALEPHSVSIHCNCEYGFKFDHETEKCG